MENDKIQEITILLMAQMQEMWSDKSPKEVLRTIQENASWSKHMKRDIEKLKSDNFPYNLNI